MPDQPSRALRIFLTVFLFAFSLPGCDMIQQKMGLENPAAKAAKDEADGKAVGGACRQSGRAIEDCYSIYSWLPRAAIYDGWRDMDAYMRDNKLETIAPQLPPRRRPHCRRRRRKKRRRQPMRQKRNKPAQVTTL